MAYAFVGVATAAINVGLYHLLLFFGLDYKLANLTAIIAAKVFAYVGNKFLVFRTRCHSFGAWCRELAAYIAARSFTGVLDFFGLIFAVEVLSADPVWAKYILQIIVIIANYFLGKFLVFTKSRNSDSDHNFA